MGKVDKTCHLIFRIIPRLIIVLRDEIKALNFFRRTNQNLTNTFHLAHAIILLFTRCLHTFITHVSIDSCMNIN